MKTFLTILFLTTSIAGFAKSYAGKIQFFTGRAVTTGQEYAYYALQFADQRVSLPSYLNLPELYNSQATIIVDGDLRPVFCTDMSKKCQTGIFSNITSLEIQSLKLPTMKTSTYVGDLQAFNSVTTGQTKLLMVTAENKKISLPKNIIKDIAKLYKTSAKLDIELTANLGNAPCFADPCSLKVRQFSKITFKF